MLSTTDTFQATCARSLIVTVFPSASFVVIAFRPKKVFTGLSDGATRSTCVASSLSVLMLSNVLRNLTIARADHIKRIK